MNAVLLEKWKGVQSFEPVKCRVPRHMISVKKKAKSCYLSGRKRLVIKIEIPAQHSHLILI